MSDIISLLIVGAAMALVIVGFGWLWWRRHGQQALATGAAARDAEVSDLTAQLAVQTEANASLKGRVTDAEHKIQHLQDARNEAQREVARLGERGTRIPALEAQLEAAQGTIEGLRTELAQAQEERKLMQQQLEQERTQSEQKLKLLTEAKEELSNQFKALASEILDQKSKKFTEQNKTSIEGLITPLKEQLTKFDKQVGEARIEDAKARQKVSLELQQLRELGLALSDNATALTHALKSDTKAQGTWGEMILETVLEKSGLEKGREYLVQETRTTEDGKRIRPDVLLRLPENKVIVIDSKVSLTAYERAVNADTEPMREDAITEHVASVRRHIAELGKKDYHTLIGEASLDFVLVFVPNESALTLALNQAPELFDLAIERNIGLVSPNLLMVTLRTIENLWRTERQNQNALEIAKQAGALYDKFVLFMESLEDIGKHLDRANDAYSTAHKRISSGKGNLVNQSERLKKLGAETNKSLPTELVSNASEDIHTPLPECDATASGS